MKIKFTYSVLLFSFLSFAQELHLPVFTQYLADNNFVLSPTFAGIGDNLRIRANGLTQWVGIKEAPKNQSLYADFRIGNRSGIGISLYNDSNGNTFQTGAKFSFAHHIILDYYSKQYLFYVYILYSYPLLSPTAFAGILYTLDYWLLQCPETPRLLPYH